jgi:hypothetical protein
MVGPVRVLTCLNPLRRSWRDSEPPARPSHRPSRGLEKRVYAPSMLALSVRQPWANLIASGRKTIELRSWSTEHRGPLAIVSGKDIDRVAAARLRSAPAELEPLGCVLCTVELVECRFLLPQDAKPACAKRFTRDELDTLVAWILRRARRVAPSPVRGKLGLFELDLDASALRAVRSAPVSFVR